jgi:hypothetical protein
MFEKLFSLPKRYWLMLHVLELVLGFLVFMYMNLHMGLEVLSWSQMVVSYVSSFVFFAAVSIAVFPISVSMIHSFNEIFEYISEYLAISVVVIPFIVYYVLWLVPDKKWNGKQFYWVSQVRVVWFLISSVAAWIVLFQPL